MKANELRIGNWVNNNEEDYQITSATIAQLERGDSTAKPILLTEEWLVKFGFEPLPFANILNSYNKSIGRNRILSVTNCGTTNEMIWICELNAKDSEKIDDLVCIRNYDYDKYTHVHQLQNLYFALSNDELTLKK